ncbi:prepilin-type N-terminal cleavage/methylation domain-containing protein [Candidatus Woesebacteria bacterium]|nr:prepilin-type N-terminal cleavage/methylation domain-containing protein [Candidatus Woesebacteria bacterium]
MKVPARKLQRGFTLIELLIVIGILAILLAITLVALNPAKQFAQSNDTKRRSDINAILNAIHQYSADNQGLLTGLSIPVEAEAGAGCQASNIANGAISNTGADICSEIVPEFMAALPVDPQVNNGDPITEAGCTDVAGYTTGYSVIQSSSNSRVTVCATGEITVNLSVTR